MSQFFCKMCPVIETPPSSVRSSAVQSRTEAATQRRSAALWCKVGSADKPQSHKRQQGYAASGGGSIEERLNDYGLSTRRTYGHLLGHSPFPFFIPSSSSSSSHHAVASFASPSRHTHMCFCVHVCVRVCVHTYKLSAAVVAGPRLGLHSLVLVSLSCVCVCSHTRARTGALALELVLVLSCLCSHSCSLCSCCALSDWCFQCRFLSHSTSHKAARPPTTTTTNASHLRCRCTRMHTRMHMYVCECVCFTFRHTTLLQRCRCRLRETKRKLKRCEQRCQRRRTLKSDSEWRPLCVGSDVASSSSSASTRCLVDYTQFSSPQTFKRSGCGSFC